MWVLFVIFTFLQNVSQGYYSDLMGFTLLQKVGDRNGGFKMSQYQDFFGSKGREKINSSNTIRKKHKNKYEQFSKAIEDRSEEEYFQRLEQMEQERARQQVVRQTTIPVMKTNSDERINAGTTSNITRPKIRELISNFELIDPSDPFTFGYVEIGSIITPHGVHGEIKLETQSEFVEDLVTFSQSLAINNQTIFIKRPDRRTPRPIQLLSIRQQTPTIFLIKLEGITSRIKASLLKRYKVYLLKSDLSPLQTNEYIIRDLIGLDCFNWNENTSGETMKPLGTVEGVIPPEELCDNPSLVKLMHCLLEIRKVGSRELCLIPFVPSIVKEVNLEGKKILLDPPPGILDLTYVADEIKIIRGLLPAHIDWLSAEIRNELELRTSITTLRYAKND